MIYKCCLKLCVEKAGFVFVVLDFAFLDEYWISYCQSVFWLLLREVFNIF